MDVILNRKGGQVTITEDIIKAAVGNWMSGPEVMEVILGQSGDKVTITEDIVKAADGNWESGAEVMKIVLDRRGPQLIITEAATAAIFRLVLGSPGGGWWGRCVTAGIARLGNCRQRSHHTGRGTTRRLYGRKSGRRCALGGHRTLRSNMIASVETPIGDLNRDKPFT